MAEALTRAADLPDLRQTSVETLRPFCSRRCADVDLGRWLTERYRIPADADETSGESAVEQT